jgi:hypothetical protein
VETVLPGRTGLFFNEPTAAGLRAALDNFRGLSLNRAAARDQALLFSRERFKSRINDFLRLKWREFKEKT